MQREIANVAAHCALQGFRYMAFPPLVFEAVATVRTAGAPAPVETTPALEPVADMAPSQAPAPRPRRIALLDDIAPGVQPMAAQTPRQARREATSRMGQPIPELRAARNAPGPRAERVTPPARAERATPPARAERVTPPARAERATPPARAERATRYALLRDLSDEQR